MSKSRKECGEARAKALTPERRKEISLMGVRARSEIKIPKATHQGILRIMGKELPCVVLDDGRRIITQKSIFDAFDRPSRGARNKTENGTPIPAFLDSKNIKPQINDQIKEMIRPIEYLNLNGTKCSGFAAQVIPTVCEIYLNLQKENKLTSNQVRIAVISDLLIRSLATVGIIGLIDEATGYQDIRPRDALEAYLNKIIQKELSPWIKRFPDEYFSNIYQIRGWPAYSTSKNKFSCVGNYTNDLIYSRIGEDVLAELKEKTPDTSKTKMHQWLTVDTGHPLLSKHMSEIIMLQKLAIAQGYGWKRFVDMVNLVLPKKVNALEIKE